MVTRIYLPSSGATRISPAFAGAWDVVTGADRVRAVAGLASKTGMASKSTAETSATPVNVLSRQYIVGPLKAVEISGTVKGRIRAQEANADADYRAQLVIRVVSSDGGTVRGTLRAADSEALSSEFGTWLTNRAFPLAALAPQALTPVTAEAGDWLVIEIGYRSHNAHTTSRNGTFHYGDAAASDLPEDETTTTDLNPWIEFSQDIAIQEIETRQVLSEVAGSYDGPIEVRQVLSEVAGSYDGPIEVRQVVAEVAYVYGLVQQMPYVHGCIIPNAQGRAVANPEYSDRASWRTDYDGGATHADDWVAGDSHHRAVTLGAGSAEELTLDGQELTLAEVLTPTEHTAIGDASPHHARLHALASESDHIDIENSAKSDGRVLVWRAAAGKHVYEDVVAAPASGNYAVTAGYATSIGDGVSTVYTVTHSLNTWDVIVQIYDTNASPSEQVAATVELTGADTISVTFQDAAAVDQYRVLVTAVNVGVSNTVAVEEEDGDPSVIGVDTIKFPNGSLTDNGDGSVSVAHHAPVTLSAEAADLLALLGQELDMNAQAANTVLAGPVTGVAAAPTFRALAAADMPVHADAHENGGADEISVAGLSGTLADQQTPVDHDHSGDAGDGGTFDAANLTSGAAADGQVLTADGAGGAAWEDASGGGGVATDPIWDAKGDLAVGTGPNAASRLAAGTDGHILYADNSQATGVKWAAPPAGGGAFTDLTDVPASYVGHGGKYVAVKATQDGLEFL